MITYVTSWIAVAAYVLAFVCGYRAVPRAPTLGRALTATLFLLYAFSCVLASFYHRGPLALRFFLISLVLLFICGLSYWYWSKTGGAQKSLK